MKTHCCILLLCLPIALANAQRMPKHVIPPDQPQPQVQSEPGGELQQPLPLKHPGHYSLSDWRQLIDSTWGPGLPTATKLNVFDAFWNGVDQTWGGFPNLSVNWDSMKAVYRPMVAAGVSRGRFAGILTRLTRELNEWHVGVLDQGIDSTMGYSPDLVRWNEYPNYASFRYRAGLPILNLNILYWRTNFGAGLTAVNDSTIVVYSVQPGHPLGLQPGDIISGYDGKPWRKLVDELLDAELPILSSDLAGVRLGSTPQASLHTKMISAGMNWGLFDTIDVVKYPSNDTLHFPTALLSGITAPYLIATEQLPVKGVSFPDLAGNKLVSWGVIEGTKIGYVYGWDWCGRPQGATQQLFGQAIDELMHVAGVEGLILDFRTNPGGWPEYANDGFRHLFNQDPSPNFSDAIRVRGYDHLAFQVYPIYSEMRFTPTPEIFDHPIAVLTGPLNGSSGDYNTFRLRFHPMVRFFGRPNSGAYTDMSNNSLYGTIAGPYFYRIDDGSVYSNVNNEGLLIHKPFAIDEEVWLTRDGIAKGEDDVVKRALRWINTLSYVHDASALNPYVRPGGDSLTITAVLTNPGSDSMATSLVMKNSAGIVQDSAVMMNDGLHGDGSPGDSILGARFNAPPTEDFYTVDLRTRDYTIGSSRLVPGLALFTTAGPVVCVGDTSNTDPQWGLNVAFRLKVSNKGTTASTPAIAGTIRSLDTAATVVWGNQFAVGDITPGQVRISSQIQIAFSSWAAGTRDIHFELLFSSNSIQCWRDTLKIRVVDPIGIVQDLQGVPTIFALDQNYPNPFNPTTVISCQLPAASRLRLVVYDLLGREVATLMDELKEPGRHEMTFDASGLASGFYVYRLTAGEYVASRKMLLVK
jgi:hypothetical protein